MMVEQLGNSWLMMVLPGVPHKAVAEVSRTGNLQERLVVVIIGLALYLSMQLFIQHPIFVYVSICQSIFLSISLFRDLFNSLSLCLSFHWSCGLSIYLVVYLLIQLSILSV